MCKPDYDVDNVNMSIRWSHFIWKKICNKKTCDNRHYFTVKLLTKKTPECSFLRLKSEKSFAANMKLLFVLVLVLLVNICSSHRRRPSKNKHVNIDRFTGKVLIPSKTGENQKKVTFPLLCYYFWSIKDFNFCP